MSHSLPVWVWHISKNWLFFPSDIEALSGAMHAEAEGLHESRMKPTANRHAQHIMVPFLTPGHIIISISSHLNFSCFQFIH